MKRVGKEKQRQRNSSLLRERVLCPLLGQKGGDLRVHFVYPNSYRIGMASLSYQHVLALFAKQAGVVVERGFLPDDFELSSVTVGRLSTLNSERSLADCDVLAFSISFEPDFLNVIWILNELKLLPDVGDSARRPPLIIAGGSAVTLNPEPIAELLDIAFIGEAEESLPQLIELVQRHRRDGSGWDEISLEAAKIGGIYVPRLYRPRYAGSHLAGFDMVAGGVEQPIRKIAPSGVEPAHSVILSPEAEFSSMFLIEMGRGCEGGCRFCVSGHIYRPVRKWSRHNLEQVLAENLGALDKVGLLGAAVSSHQELIPIVRNLVQGGSRVSLSSLMAKKVTPELAELLRSCGYRSAALAPEAGTEQLRAIVGKDLDDVDLERAAVILAENGIGTIKLYFMVGLPGETRADIDAIPRLAQRLRKRLYPVEKKRGSAVQLVFSINAFVPKAWTPFQWEPMADLKYLKGETRRLSKSLAVIANSQVKVEPLNASLLQALLSRADRRILRYLIASVRCGDGKRSLLKIPPQDQFAGLTPLGYFVHRRWGIEEILPWDIIDAKIDKGLLRREAKRAGAAIAACQPVSEV